MCSSLCVLFTSKHLKLSEKTALIFWEKKLTICQILLLFFSLPENGEEPLCMLLCHWRNTVSITALWAVWIRAVTAASWRHEINRKMKQNLQVKIKAHKLALYKPSIERA